MGYPLKISLIAAMDLNRAIGKQGTLPWKIKSEMALFKRLTMGKTVLMGRKTAESIGKPLPGRNNLVLSSTLKEFPGMAVVRNMGQAMDLCQNELMVIGGADVYRQALPLAQEINLTTIEMVVKDADAFFPTFDEGEWRTAISMVTQDSWGVDPTYTYRLLIRK